MAEFINSGTAAARTASRIEAAFGRLSSASSELDRAIDALSVKIAPVTASAVPCDEKCGQISAAPSCTMDAEITDQAAKLENLAAYVRSLTDRCQL